MPGKGSGKRTLVDVLDEDFAAKRMKTSQASSTNNRLPTHSRFFAPSSSSKKSTVDAADDLMPGPPRTAYLLCGKENLLDHAVDNVTVVEELEDFLDEPPDPVVQEDGYLSPGPSYFRSATPDLSSPVRPYSPARNLHDGGDDFGADIISSPTVVRATTQHTLRQGLSLEKEKINILVRETPPPMADTDPTNEIEGPDLRDVLDIEALGDIDEDEITMSSCSTPGRITLEDSGMNDGYESLEEDLGTEVGARGKRTEIVASGWWNKWARTKELRPSEVRLHVP